MRSVQRDFMGEVITTHILKCTIFKNQFKKGEQKHVCLLKTGIRKKKKKDQILKTGYECSFVCIFRQQRKYRIVSVFVLMNLQ